MRSLTAAFILMVSAMVAMLIQSCSLEDDPQFTAPPTDESGSSSVSWTVLYYGAGNYAGDQNGSESRTMSLLRSMQRVFPSEHVKIAALVASAETGGACRFYEVLHSSYSTDTDSNYGLLSDWGSDGSMASPEMFRRFVDSAITRFPAEKYMLVLGGYGEGWRGAFLDESHENAMMPIFRMREALDSRSSGDDARAPFELMLWTAPRMGMLEVAYEFRNLARFMVATPEIVEFDHPGAVSRWLRDLNSEPEMDGELLGRLVLRAINEAAVETDASVHCALYDLARTRDLGPQIEAFADELSLVGRGNREEIVILGDSLRHPADDPLSVDLAAYAAAAARTYQPHNLDEDPEAKSGLVAAARAIQTSVDRVVVEMRPARDADARAGLMIHFPRWAQEVDVADYDSLEFYRTYPAWYDLLSTSAPVRRDPVRVSGLLRFFVRSQMENAHLFLLTGSDWSSIEKDVPIPMQFVNAIGDSARFSLDLPMATDSIRCLLGVYLDADSNGFAAGDYWAIHRNTGGFVWHNLKPGDILNNLDLFISNRR